MARAISITLVTLFVSFRSIEPARFFPRAMGDGRSSLCSGYDSQLAGHRRMEEFHDSEIRGQKLYDFNCFSFLRFVMELLVTIYQNRISMMRIFGNGDRNGNNEKNPALN